MAQTCFRKKQKLGITLTKIYWSLGRKTYLSTCNTLLIYIYTSIYKGILNLVELTEKSLGYGFFFFEGFQSRAWRMIEEALLLVKYGYPRESPYTTVKKMNPTLQLSIQYSPHCTPKQPSSEHHGATLQ
jgi:hypothetical protein